MELINQIIQSTNDSIAEYFESKTKRVGDVYTKMLADVDQERLGARVLLDKMITNSKETVVNLQHYFAEVMDITMEKTYSDIKSILANAVNKIDSVSRMIRENIRVNKDELKQNQSLVLQQEAGSQKSLAKLINSGVEAIQRLAHKFKNEPAVAPDFSKLLS